MTKTIESIYTEEVKLLKYSKAVLYSVLTLLITGLFFLTRSAEYITRNFVFVLDQGRDYDFVKTIVVNHKLTLIGSEIGGGYAGFQGIFQGPLHFYILSIFFALFKGNPFGGMVYMGIFAILSVVTAFFVARKIFDTITALIITLLITIAPEIISQASFDWNPHPILPFILLTFLFVYLMQKRKLKYIFLTTFFAAVTYNFEIAITVPLLLAIFLYSFLVVRIYKIKEILGFIAGIVAGFLPLILFEARHHFTVVNSAVGYFTNTQHTKGYTYLNTHLADFIINFRTTFAHQEIVPLLFVFLALVLPAAYFFIREQKKEVQKFLIFLVLLWGSTIFILAFLKNFIFMYYLYQLNLVYIFFFGYVCYAAIKRRNLFIVGLQVCLLLLYVVNATTIGIRDFKNNTSDINSSAKYKAKLAAIDYIYKDAKGKPFGLYIFYPPVYTYPYDYLAWWRGTYVYGYQPNQNKDGLFYLLIEKDPNMPWTYKGWEQTVIKTGKVLQTTTLPSGIIVEKRCGPACR